MTTTPRSQNHLAAMLGISKATCSEAVKRGMPVDSLEAAQAWRARHLDPARRKQAKDTPEALPPIEPPLESFDEAKTRDKIAEADMREMAAAKRRGELIEVAAVVNVLAHDFATTRDALLQLPSRLAAMLAAERDPAAVQNLLHAEIHQALVTLAGAPDAVREIAGGGGD